MPADDTPIYVQHEVDEVIYREYFCCTQSEVVVINTCQRCYQFHHADVLAICLVARWAGVPLSVAFRTFYDDDHGSLQALVAGYHLDPAIFFVLLPPTLNCPAPYQRPYQLFRTLRANEASYSNEEYRALIALKIACDYQGRQASEFFAVVHQGDAPLQVVYRTPNTPPSAGRHLWSGAALHPLPPPVPGTASASASAIDHRHGATALPPTHGASAGDATAAPHAASSADIAGRADQPARSEAPEHAGATSAGSARPNGPASEHRAGDATLEHAAANAHDQPAHGEAPEHAWTAVGDGGRGGTRPSGPPLERRSDEAAERLAPPGRTASVPPLGPHPRSEPATAAAAMPPASGGQPAAGSGQAATAGSGASARHQNGSP